MEGHPFDEAVALHPQADGTFVGHTHAAHGNMVGPFGGMAAAQAQAQTFRDGFFDQVAQLWNEAGKLLVTTHQIVYYKE